MPGFARAAVFNAQRRISFDSPPHGKALPKLGSRHGCPEHKFGRRDVLTPRRLLGSPAAAAKGDALPCSADDL